MAKELQLLQLTKKGLKAEFNLIGAAKISDKTFAIDVESAKENSDWVYNKLNLGVDCGKDGIIYATMQGGFGTARDNVVFVHGTKEENGKMIDDYENRFKIDWEDRFDEDVLKTLGDGSFMKMGVIKDEDGKTVVERFLTPYDAIKYLKENLKDGTIVNVKGNLEYKVWDGKVQYNKTITSIFLSKAEKQDFKAKFTQTILVDDRSIGKLDKETNTVPITASIVELVKEYEGQPLMRLENGKKLKGLHLPLMKTFTFEIGEDKENALRMLKQFRVKSKKELDRITVEGKFTRGNIDTVAVTIDDITDKDILEMIELGYIKAEDVLNQMAKANNQGSSPELMVIENPKIKFVENKDTGKRLPQLDKVEKAYKVENISIPLLIETFNVANGGAEIEKKEEVQEEISEKDALNQVLESLDDDDQNWLDQLEN